MKRRTLTALLLIGVLTSLCLGGSAYAKEIELTIWHGIGNVDHEMLVDLFDSFNEEYKGEIQIKELVMGWNQVYEKIAMARLVGDAPDIVIVHTSQMDRCVREELIIPLDTYFAQIGLGADDFLEAPWQGIVKNGKHYAMPFDVHTIVAWYNADHWAEAGLDIDLPQQKPLTYDEVVAYGKKLTLDEAGTGNPSRYGWAYPPREQVLFWSLLWQYGGTLFDEARSKSIVDSEAGVEAMRVVDDLINKYGVALPHGGGLTEFCQRKISGYLGGTYEVMGLRAQEDLNYRLGLFPQFGPKRAARLGSHTISIVNQQPLDPQRVQAAVEWMKWMSEHSAKWAWAGHVPANRRAVQSDEFLQNAEMLLAMKQFEWGQYPPSTIADSQMWVRTEEAIESVISGEVDPVDAVKLLARQLTEAINTGK